jgi:hypothetical protein
VIVIAALTMSTVPPLVCPDALRVEIALKCTVFSSVS